MFHVQPRRVSDWCISVSGVLLCYLRWCAHSSAHTTSKRSGASGLACGIGENPCMHNIDLQGVLYTHAMRHSPSAGFKVDVWVKIMGSGCGPISWWDKYVDSAVCFCVVASVQSLFPFSISVARIFSLLS